MADELDRSPKKGDAAPLEGTMGPVAAVLSRCFSFMQPGMCLALTRSIGPALEGPLLSKNELTSLSLGNNNAAPAVQTPMMSAMMQPPAIKGPGGRR